MFCEMLESLPGFRPNVTSPSVETQERLPLHCVSIPGETVWATTAIRRSGACWRPRPTSERSAATQKRAHAGDDEDDAMPDCDTSAAPPGDAKRSRATSGDGRDHSAGSAPPVGSSAGAMAAVVKLYGADAARVGDGAIKVRRASSHRLAARTDAVLISRKIFPPEDFSPPRSRQAPALNLGPFPMRAC
jgi:hypothetical protein